MVATQALRRQAFASVPCVVSEAAGIPKPKLRSLPSFDQCVAARHGGARAARHHCALVPGRHRERLAGFAIGTLPPGRGVGSGAACNGGRSSCPEERACASSALKARPGTKLPRHRCTSTERTCAFHGGKPTHDLCFATALATSTKLTQALAHNPVGMR